jgi:AcrR family transcriptional regulator
VAGRSKKPSGPKAPDGRPATGPVTDAAILEAALRLAARDGWRAVGPSAIAAEAGIALAPLYDAFPDKPAILAGLMRLADRAMLASDAEPGSSPRDRLFDIIMRRFDALQPFRAGLVAIAEAGPDPLTGLAVLQPLRRSLTWMLETAGLGSAGIAGQLRLVGLAVVYASAFRVWLKDDSPDLGKTMASVDRGLAQAERWASALPFAGRRS